MKFIANVLVKVEIEADTEEFAKELLSEKRLDINLGKWGCSSDHGSYSLKLVGQRVMNIQKKNFQFVLKIKRKRSIFKIN